MDIILWNDDQGRVVAFTPPGGMTAEEAKVDGSLVPQDRDSFIKDNATLPSDPLSTWRMDEEGNVTVDGAAVAALSPEGRAAATALIERRAAALEKSPDLKDQFEGLKLRLQLLRG